MTRLCYFSTTGGEIPLLAPALSELSRDGVEIDVVARTSQQVMDAAGRAEFVDAALACDAIVLSLHGGLESCPAWDDLAQALDDPDRPSPWLHLQPSGADEVVVLEAQTRCAGMADGTWQRLVPLLDAGDLPNLVRALTVIDRALSGESCDDLEAEPVPDHGIYHPWHPHTTTLLDLGVDGTRPSVAIVFPQTYWLQHNVAHVDALIKALEDRGAVAFGVFSHIFRDDARGYAGWGATARELLTVEGQCLVDVIVSMQGFSITTIDPSLSTLYPDLGVPVLQALTASIPRAEWEASVQGVATVDVSVQAAQPEFDGALISRVVATRETDEIDRVTGGAITRLVGIPDRVASMAQLALSWATLRRTAPRDRRIAVIFHHHPPRNDRIGCATGLDTFESVRLLLQRLAADGYDVPEQFETADELAQTMLASMTCDRRWLTPDAMIARAEATIDATTARRWHSDLPVSNQADLERSWGSPPGSLFVHEDTMGFAGHLDGNVFLTIQPPRGSLEKVTEEGMHDPVLPPPHHYLAHYRWIRDEFRAHAVVHVGTHGSLEWLPGKALGLSEECYPELALAHLPNIYPYIINNPGEGTQAKRRSAAVLVDYLTPPMRNADLDDETAPLDLLCREHADARSQTADRGVSVAQVLWQKVKDADLHLDLGLDPHVEPTDWDRFVEDVRHYLLTLSDNMISDGLHVLGRVAAADPDIPDETPVLGPRPRAVDFIVQLVRLPNGDVPSLREAVLEAWGTSLDEARDAGTRTVPGTGRCGIDLVRDAHETCRHLVDEVLDAATGKAPRTAETSGSAVSRVLGRRHAAVEHVLDYIIDDLVPRLCATDDELEAVVHALEGGFIEPGPSGAATRGNAGVLPSGRNFYSLDPRTLPTRGAWAVGVALAESLLSRYAQEHPDDPYPRNVGLILWGTANMRSRGEDIAEILHLWGLRPRWAADGRVLGVEVVGLEELGRPRIDATPRISGFFRDAFPTLVELLDDCASLVAALDEGEGNLLRAHVMADAAQHRASGMGEEEAWRLASLRVFGCPPGTYAAGVEELVESKRWETRADLGNAYIAASSHAYGRGIYGEQRLDAFRAQLARMDVTVKNEDSREYDMLSCTDFYNYYGGLIAAAETVRGEAPMSFVGDSSDPRDVRNRTTNEEARLVIRSRLLNRTWIEGLQRHGYKGAGDLSKVLDILAGWEATADVVDDAMFERVARTYALDPQMQQWFGEVNPYALTNIIDKLLDMIHRGLWDADDQMTRDLTTAYLDAEADVEAAADAGSRE